MFTPALLLSLLAAASTASATTSTMAASGSGSGGCIILRDPSAAQDLKVSQIGIGVI